MRFINRNSAFRLRKPIAKLGLHEPFQVTLRSLTAPEVESFLHDFSGAKELALTPETQVELASWRRTAPADSSKLSSRKVTLYLRRFIAKRSKVIDSLAGFVK